MRGTQYMVATSQPQAALAAAQILNNGGNAMDAAICASAVLAVVEPQSTGLGGDCCVLYSKAGSDAIIAYDGTGHAPSYAHRDWYHSNGYLSLPERGPHSVTVPGAVDAWCTLLEDHGTLELGTVLGSAIEFAKQGYVVHERIAADWSDAAPWLLEDPQTAAVFLDRQEPYRAGQIHRQPKLARTLEIIASEGADGFYKGAVAADIVSHLRTKGGLHTEDDFADLKGKYVQPVEGGYRGFRVFQMPPANQGITCLLILAALEEHAPKDTNPLAAARLADEIHAAKIAFSLRDKYIGDPDFCDDCVAAVLSDSMKEEARRRMSGRYDEGNASAFAPRMSNTAYVSVVDEDRNSVSMISSTFDHFGSCVTAPNSGVVLQNRAAGFNLKRGHPNCIAPHKRPLHTIMPGMICEGNRVVMSFGVMGGDYQPLGQSHVLSNIIDYGLDVQQSIDCPRLFFDDRGIIVESGVPSASCEQLRNLGFVVNEVSRPLGGAQAVWIDWQKGTLAGASDARKDGCAIGR